MHTSRQLHCRDVCKISLWLVEYISNQCTAYFGRISNSIEIPLVWRAHGAHFTNRQLTRSRRNPRSRCAWLTGPEPRSGYARTSFGIDAAAEVTIWKCNLWKSWTLKLTPEFSHAHLTIFSTAWDTCWFYQDHASRRNAKLQKIYQ